MIYLDPVRDHNAHMSEQSSIIHTCEVCGGEINEDTDESMVEIDGMKICEKCITKNRRWFR